MNAFSHLSYFELENRKKFLKQEYHRVCAELEKRKNSSNLDGELWEPYEDLKKKIVREFTFPNEIPHESDIEERKLTKEGTQSIRNIIKEIKSGMKNEIAKDIGLINKDVQRLLEIGDNVSNQLKNQNNTMNKPLYHKNESKNEEEDESDEDESDESEDEVEEIELSNDGKNTELTTKNETKKRVLGKGKKTYENLNTKIRDLWSNN
jgi:hypothetical protein